MSRRIESPAIGSALVILHIVACGTPQPTPVPTQPGVVEPPCTPQPTPRIIEHPEPAEDYRPAVGDICDPGPEHYYYTDVSRDTHVAEVVDGYHIKLFYSEKFGCGPFPVSSVIVEVNFDGAISEFPKVKLFEQSEPRPGEKMAQCCMN